MTHTNINKRLVEERVANLNILFSSLKLDVCLKKLKPFRSMQKDEILKDPHFQDIIERNLQVAAQSVIDIANRIISFR